MANIPYPTVTAVALPKQAPTNPTVAGTTWSGLPNFDAALTALVNRNILELQRNALRWMQPGAYRSGQLIEGTNLIRYMAYGDLPINDSLVLIEGEANPPVALAMGYDEFGVQQRMRTVRITDVALDTNPHGLMSIAAERLAYNALAVVDWLVATEVARSTVSVKWTAGRLNRAALTAPDVLNAAEIRKAVAYMKKRNIAPFPDGYYRAMVDPNVVFDLMGETAIGGWIEASKYTNPENLLSGELGRMYGVRFIESNIGLWIDNTTFPKYRTVFYGPEYFVFGDLQSTRSYMVRPGNDHADPAAQAALLSWKGMYGASVLGGDAHGAAALGAGPRHLIVEHAANTAGV